VGGGSREAWPLYTRLGGVDWHRMTIMAFHIKKGLLIEGKRGM